MPEQEKNGSDIARLNIAINHGDIPRVLDLINNLRLPDELAKIRLVEAYRNSANHIGHLAQVHKDQGLGIFDKESAAEVEKALALADGLENGNVTVDSILRPAQPQQTGSQTT